MAFLIYMYSGYFINEHIYAYTLYFKWNQANYIVHAMTNLKLGWQIVSEKSSLYLVQLVKG